MPYDSPVKNNYHKVTPDDGRYRGLNTRIVEIPGKNRQLITYCDREQHQIDHDAKFGVLETKNWGKDILEKENPLEDEVVARDQPGEHLGAQGGRLMDDSRIGFIVSRFLDGTGNTPAFIYSDDGGKNWSTKELSQVAGDGISPVNHMYRYPSSVGGADNGGWICFTTDRNTKEVIYFATTDNGDNWEKGVALQNISGDRDLYEPDVCRIGNDDRWIIAFRINYDSASANARMATSTNLTDWSSPVDTGITIGENPPVLQYFDGKIWWSTCSRDYDGHSPSKKIDDWNNEILHQTVDAETIWNDLTAWPGWEKFSDGEIGNLGYGDTMNVDGRMTYALALNDVYNGNIDDKAQGAVFLGDLKEGNKPVSFDHEISTDDSFVVEVR